MQSIVSAAFAVHLQCSLDHFLFMSHGTCDDKGSHVDKLSALRQGPVCKALKC